MNVIPLLVILWGIGGIVIYGAWNRIDDYYFPIIMDEEDKKVAWQYTFWILLPLVAITLLALALYP